MIASFIATQEKSYLRVFARYMRSAGIEPGDLLNDTQAWLAITPDHAHGFLKWLLDRYHLSTIHLYMRLLRRITAHLVQNGVPVDTLNTAFQQLNTAGVRNVAREHGVAAPVLDVLAMSQAERDAFWSFVQRGADSDCWPWLGVVYNNVPMFPSHGSYYSPARVAYQLQRGALAPGAKVRRTCDSPMCVNPAHRVERTAQQGENEHVLVPVDSPSSGVSKRVQRVRRLVIPELTTLLKEFSKVTQDSVNFQLRKFNGYLITVLNTHVDLLHNPADWQHMTRSNIEGYLRFWTSSKRPPAIATLVNGLSNMRLAARLGAQAGLITAEAAGAIVALRTYNATNLVPDMSDEAFAAYFWQQVNRSAGPEGCWTWKGERCRGIGRVRRGAFFLTPYRVAWELTYRVELGVGGRLMQRCMLAGCCNPRHYQRFLTAIDRAGVAAQQAAEEQARLDALVATCVEIAASVPLEGPVPTGQNKLTRAKVATMLVLLDRMKPLLNCNRLSQAFGISRQMMKVIADREAWTSVNAAEAPQAVHAAITAYVQADQLPHHTSDRS